MGEQEPYTIMGLPVYVNEDLTTPRIYILDPKEINRGLRGEMRNLIKWLLSISGIAKGKNDERERLPKE